MNDGRARLGERLVAKGRLSPRDLERALAAQGEIGERLGSVLIKLGLCSESDVLQALSEQTGIPIAISSDWEECLPLIVEGLREAFIDAHRVVPFAVSDGVLFYAAADPLDSFISTSLELATHLRVRPHFASAADIELGLRKYHDGATSDEDSDDEADGVEDEIEFVENLRDLASDAPVIRWVNEVVAGAVDLGASDIHVEPFDGECQVRYRVDGVLTLSEGPSLNLVRAVISRIKLLAGLDISEQRLPQDGRIRMRSKGRDLDLRVSTVPTMHGESVVMRVLDRNAARMGLDRMGFSDTNLVRFRRAIHRPFGLVLLTGPTGSGKTTTQYASLTEVSDPGKKILTVEDPVEYQLAGINQIAVHPQIGLDFPQALRSILRQDPDIVMIGEMRDTETAKIAVQAALTGHLVLSTLHTNTSIGAIARLADMGVERFLIASSLICVVAQRLVRRLCDHCKRPLNEASKECVPVGCEACGGSGYSGRFAIHEVLEIDDDLRQLITGGAPSEALEKHARAAGMKMLYDDGLRAVAAGMTSRAEVLRVANESNDV
ncbi:MAG: GspE/PulE family protein [Thioalkalivibrionaceae bacterium]